MCLCFDIENVFLAEIDPSDKNETRMLDDCTNVAKHFIVVKRKGYNNIKCKPNCMSDGLCACKIRIFNIRPYTHEILNGLHPFFELIGLLNMPKYEMNQVIKQLEKYLNKTIKEKNKQTLNKMKDEEEKV